MPKYELLYIIGSHVSDDEIPKITGEVKKYIADESGVVEKQEDLGKKKLAYPIKHTKTGYYVQVNFSAPSDKVANIDHKIRMNQTIIRHLYINLEEALVRQEKDRVLQSKLKPRIMKEEPKEKPISDKPERKITIDLDAEIEKALDTEDLK